MYMPFIFDSGRESFIEEAARHYVSPAVESLPRESVNNLLSDRYEAGNIG